MTVGKIENGLERGFVKHRLYYLLITDPMSFAYIASLHAQTSCFEVFSFSKSFELTEFDPNLAAL